MSMTYDRARDLLVQMMSFYPEQSVCSAGSMCTVAELRELLSAEMARLSASHSGGFPVNMGWS